MRGWSGPIDRSDPMSVRCLASWLPYPFAYFNFSTHPSLVCCAHFSFNRLPYLLTTVSPSSHYGDLSNQHGGVGAAVDRRLRARGASMDMGYGTGGSQPDYRLIQGLLIIMLSIQQEV